MQIKALAALAIAAVANAAAVPKAEALTGEVKLAVSDGKISELVDLSANITLSKRAESATANIVGGHDSDAGVAAGAILNQLLQDLFPLKDWTAARETFTQQTTQLLYNNNPNPSAYPAVVCYNKGWRTKNSAISGVVDMDLSLGALHTDYDCMYIGHGNQFYTDGDGGYINLCYRYDANYCSFDGSTGDLTCN